MNMRGKGSWWGRENGTQNRKVSTQLKQNISVKSAPIATRTPGNILVVVPSVPCAGDALHCTWKSMVVEIRQLQIRGRDFRQFWGVTRMYVTLTILVQCKFFHLE
jgi:hypothetical protein